MNNTEVSIEEWHAQRSHYRNKKRVSRVKSGFATFFLNRCNRSGIIVNGGPIGGINQEGKWKIDARFNKKDLAYRCNKIVEYKDRISISCDDGIEFIDKMSAEKTMFFIDPPYFGKGPTLYLDCLDQNYHQSLACKLRSMRDKAWLLTYDDCAAVRAMYSGWAQIRPYSLRYTAYERRTGREILVTPKWLALPAFQNSTGIQW